jgi:hypothetical protein
MFRKSINPEAISRYVTGFISDQISGWLEGLSIVILGALRWEASVHRNPAHHMHYSLVEFNVWTFFEPPLTERALLVLIY